MKEVEWDEVKPISDRQLKLTEEELAAAKQLSVEEAEKFLCEKGFKVVVLPPETAFEASYDATRAKILTNVLGKIEDIMVG